jgi:hypothetical protein
LNDKLTINGFAVINENKGSLPLISQYIDTYRTDLFSDSAISFIKEHFRLNSTKSPWDYIYDITSEDELVPKIILDSTVKIELATLKSMNPN